MNGFIEISLYLLHNSMHKLLKKIYFITFFYSLLFLNTIGYSIEVSSFQPEKRLEFNELFPQKICDDIYSNSNFGLAKKPEREIMLMNYINLKKLKFNLTFTYY